MHSRTYTRLFVAGIASLTLLSCTSDAEKAQEVAPTAVVIPAVEATQARFGSLPLIERFSGNVRSENQVPLYPQISGIIEAVMVENGAFVKKGEPLVKLDDEQYRQQLTQAEAGLKINNAQLKQAQAQLNQLKAEYNRTKQLADKELSSDLEMEQLQAELISAEASVELAEARVEQSEAVVSERKKELSRTIISAPISGTVGQRNAQIGMRVSTASQLFMIGDLSNVRVEIVLTENLLNKVSSGQKVEVLVDDLNGNTHIVDARISRISPFLNETTRSTEAEIDIVNTDGLLKPGMFIPVDVHFGESSQATLIPTSALFLDPTTGKEGIYVAKALGSEIQPVEATSTDELQPLTEPTDVAFMPIEVLARGRMEVGVAGIESGQWVITLGQDLLSTGRTQARVRTISWNHVLSLQQLQSEDLLKTILEDQAATPVNSPSTL